HAGSTAFLSWRYCSYSSSTSHSFAPNTELASLIASDSAFGDTRGSPTFTHRSLSVTAREPARGGTRDARHRRRHGLVRIPDHSSLGPRRARRGPGEAFRRGLFAGSDRKGVVEGT